MLSNLLVFNVSKRVGKGAVVGFVCFEGGAFNASSIAHLPENEC